MIYPNKHIRFEESIIFKMVCILEQNSGNQEDIHELYLKTQNKFKSIDEFLYSLDVLYVLDMIEVDFESETITYAKRN